MSVPLPRPTSRSTRSWPRSSLSGRGHTRCGFSCPRRSAPPTSAPWSASCAVSRPGTGTASRYGTARSSRIRDRNTSSSGRWGEAGAEWVTFDTTVLFGSPPASDTEREAWRNKPRVPRRSRALTSHPVVRYIGRDDPDRTVAGWQPWLGTVAGGAARGAFPDRVHPYARQRCRARTGAPLPRRGASPGARGRAAP